MGLTSSMEVKLVRPVRIGREILGRGRIVEEGRRRATVETTLEQDGVVGCEGRVVYVLPNVRTAERLLGQTMPDDWKHLFP